jgi:hypothetical protein
VQWGIPAPSQPCLPSLSDASLARKNLAHMSQIFGAIVASVGNSGFTDCVYVQVRRIWLKGDALSLFSR